MNNRDLVFETLVLGNPTLNEGHGSTHFMSCVNPNCELNRRGGEKHRKPIEKRMDEIGAAYRRITGNESDD